MKLFCSLLIFFKALIPDILSAEPWPFARINVMGDSHSYYSFTGDGVETNPNWTSQELTSFSYIRNNISYEVPHYKRWIGPRLMHSFGVRGCEDKCFKDINKGEYLIFALGEIDVRLHIAHQITKGRELNEVINNLTDVYFDRIKKIASEYKIIPIIFCPIPPLNEAVVKYNKLLINSLIIRAKAEDVLIFDVTEKYSNKKGVLAEAYRDTVAGGVHIHPSVNYYVRKTLCDLIWDYEMSK